MSVLLLPVGSDGQAFNDANGAPRSGAQLFVYLANTSTKATLYQNQSGATNHTNPIILNSSGQVANAGGSVKPIFIDSGSTYDVVLAPSNDTDPPASPYFTLEDISCINDVSTSVDLGSNDTITGNTSIAAASFNAISGLSNVTASAIITLPAANTVIAGKRRRFRSGTTGNVYLQRAGADTIDGISIYKIPYLSTIEITSDNISQWFVTIVPNSESQISIAAAATTEILFAASSSILLTGNSPITITSFGTSNYAGKKFHITSTGTGAHVLTHNATSLILPSEANITVSQGDSWWVEDLGGNNCRVYNYNRVSGKALITSFTVSDYPSVTNSPSAAASTTFSSLSASVRYRLSYRCTRTNASNLLLRFNADSNARYSVSGLITNTGGASLTEQSATGGTEIPLEDATNANDECFGWIEFETGQLTDNDVIVFWQAHRSASGSGTFGQKTSSGKYTGVAALSSMTISVAAGTITGTFVLQQIPG